MIIKAKANYIRISPRKVRLVADMIRGKRLGEAKDVLRFTIKKSALPILKLLNSAESNAKNNFEISPDNFYISKITVDEGPKYKRWMPRSRGQASPIQKKTSHITVVLEPLEGKIKKTKKDKKDKDVKGKKQSEERKEKDLRSKFKKEIDPAKVKKTGVAKKIFRRKSI